MGSGEKSEELAAQQQVPIPFNEHRNRKYWDLCPNISPQKIGPGLQLGSRDSRQGVSGSRPHVGIGACCFDFVRYYDYYEQHSTEQNNRSVCSRSLRGPELVDLCRLFLVKNTLKYCFNKKEKEKLNENLISKNFLKVFIINKPIKLNISHFLLMIMLLVHEPHKFLFLTFLAKLFN